MGITYNVHTLKKGSATAIGNGQKKLFWDHVWAVDKPLRSECIQPIPSSIDGATVEEMWEIGNGWKWQEFSDYLQNEVLKQVASHELVEDPNVGDLIYWRGNNKGGFSIKHALTLIRNDDVVDSNKQWDVVWKAPVQQRIRVFMWLLLHD